MSSIKLRLKDGMRYLAVGTPAFSIVISDEGENSPDGFEVDKEVYEKHLKLYAEPAPKRKRKRTRVRSIDLEE